MIMDTDSPQRYEYTSHGEMYLLTIPTLASVPIFGLSAEGKFFPMGEMDHDPSILLMVCVEEGLLYIMVKTNSESITWVGYQYVKCTPPLTNVESTIIAALNKTISYFANTNKYIILLMAKAHADNYWNSAFRKYAFNVTSTIMNAEYISVSLYIPNIGKLPDLSELRKLSTEYETDIIKIEKLIILDTWDYTEAQKCIYYANHPLAEVFINPAKLISSLISNIDMLPNLKHLEIGREFDAGLNRFEQPFNIRYVLNSDGILPLYPVPCELTHEYFKSLNRSKLKTIKLGTLYGVTIIPRSTWAFVDKNINFVAPGISKG